MPSLARFEGYLLTDHRSGPGIPEFGYPNDKKVEEATIGCVHCGAVYVKRPEFDGTRCYCRKCDRYMCNPCARAAAQPNYVHRSFLELADLVRSGQYQLAGSMSAPILIPVQKEL